MTSIRSSLVLCLGIVLPALGATAAAQQQLATLDPPLGPLCGLGDLDGDGAVDIAFRDDPGLVHVVSGGTQLTHLVLTGAATDDFGSALANAGDVDGDGLSDLVIGAQLSDVNGTDSGSLRLVSGADGSTLLTLDGLAAGAKLGRALAGLGDANGDGIPDLAAPVVTGPGTSQVLLLSGADGSVFAHCDEPISGASLFGRVLCGPGDVNADGRMDVAAGLAGRAYLFSGADGTLVRELLGSNGINTLAPGGDLDGDGVPDIAAVDEYFGDPGLGRVFSGATGEVLLTVSFSPSLFTLVESFAGLGDVDGDAVPDYVLGKIALDSQLDGVALVYSGATGDLLYFSKQFVWWGEGGLDQQFGLSIQAVGDVDEDGAGDYAAWGELGWAVQSGRPSNFDQLYLSQGFATPGLLAGTGSLVPGETIRLSATALLAGAPIFLVVGFSYSGLPFKGGELVPVPALVLGPLTANAAGALALQAPWPAGVPSGSQVWFQAWSPDPGLGSGWQQTNGLRATTP